MPNNYRVWSELEPSEVESILKLSAAGTDAEVIAKQFNLKVESLSRKLRSIKQTERKVLDHRVAAMNVDKPTRFFIFSDTHFGVHDADALSAALIVAEQFGPDVIVNLGDTLDVHRLSNYKTDPRAAFMQDEREAWVDFAEKLNRCTSASDRIIILGNHDERYMNHMLDIAGSADVPEFSVEAMLYTQELGYNDPVHVLYVNPKGDEIYPDAMLYVMHGEFARKHAGSSVRAASEMYAGASTIVGHAHRTGVITKRTARGISKSYEVGTLSRLNPQYALFPDWSQSVLTGVVSAHGFDFQTHIIDRGSVYFNGKAYRV